MTHESMRIASAVHALLAVTWHRMVSDEDGEGVISTAIAVLIMSFLGVLMWIGFKAIWGDAEANTSNQVNQIGS